VSEVSARHYTSFEVGIFGDVSIQGAFFVRMRVVVRKAHPTRCLCRRIAAKARPKLKADRGYLFLDKMTPESPKDSGAGPVESLKLKKTIQAGRLLSSLDFADKKDKLELWATIRL
jgi:hypothetical protein